MRRVSISILMLFVAFVLSAQEPKEAVSFVFEETVWDFGRIDERDGAQSHAFRFRNEADHSVAIERVYTSCGCTSTNYSRRPIRSGQESEFVVTFDPEGRGGRVDKVVTIVYDGGKGQTDLRIKGRVKARPRSVEEDYPYDLGEGMRSDAIYRTFGNVEQGRSKSMTLALANTYPRPVELEVRWIEQSGRLEVAVPTIMEGDGKALLTMTYLPGSGECGHYGSLRDRFVLVVDGKPTSQEIVATAVAVDNFKGQGVLATTCELSPIYNNFGSQSPGAVCRMEVTITNSGSAPLLIRAVEVREGTSIDLMAGESIPAGGSITRRVEMTISEQGFDTVFGGVLIVTNDAKRPVVELRLAADVK